MYFKATQAHEEFRAKVRAFAETEVKPIAFLMDKENLFPDDAVKKMGEMGLMGIPYPKEYGGAGADVLSYVMAVEEMSKVCGTTGVIISAHTSLCCAPIYENGTEEQKKYYLPKLCSGEWIGAFGLTEPGAGTDAQGQQTTAVLDEKGENWILNGSKIFITNAGYANVFVIFAITGVTTDKRGRKKKEISAFIVERTDPGFSVGKVENKMGIRSAQVSDMILEDVYVPDENMIAKPGEGFKLAMKTLDGGRIGVAAQGLGIAKGAFEIARKYLMEREQFGKPLNKQQYLAFKMAELQTDIKKAELLLYYAATCKETGQPYTVPAAMAKMTCTDTAMKVTTEAVQMLGGNGFMKEYHVERMMRDAKITQIYEGTNEIQKLVISGQLFH